MNRDKFRDRKNLALSLINPSYKHFYQAIVEIYSGNDDYNIFCFGHGMSKLDVYPPRLQRYITEPLIILCVDGDNYYRKENHKRVQMFHGLCSFGSVWGDAFITRFDALFLTGPYMKSQLSQKYYLNLLKECEIECYDVGYIKLDLLNGLIPSTNSKTIFYGPTYHVEYSSIFKWLEIIFEIASTKGFNLILKLHPLLARSSSYTYSGGIRWDKEIKKLSNYYNIEPSILTSDSLIEDQKEAFSSSNIFITDASGIGYEYILATGNPVIYLDDKIKIPMGSDKEAFLEYYEIKKRGKAGPIVYNKDELIQAIEEKYLQKNYKEEIDKLKEEFVFNLGNAGGYACEALDIEFAKINET